MSIDLHNNNDDLYRKAYERLEEEPSEAVWDKVVAKLDSWDVRHYQQKSVRWKRISLLLVLLLGIVLLTGTLYITTKKAAPNFSDTKQNDKYSGAGNTASVSSRLNDSSLPSQKINQYPDYATEPNRKSNTDAGAAIAPAATQPQSATGVSQQVDAGTGKQYSKPVQDSFITAVETTVQRQVSPRRKRNSANRFTIVYPAESPKEITTIRNYETVDKQTQMVVKKKSRRLSGPEEGKINPENKTTVQQNSTATLAFTTKRFSNGKNRESEADVDIAEEKVLFPLSSLYLNSFPAYSLFHKEAADSATTARAITMAASLKKESMKEDVVAGANKKTVRIAPLYQHRLQLTGFASLDMAEYHLHDDDDHENNNQQPAPHREDRHKIRDRENHGLSFSAGITVRYQVNKKLSFKSGLAYSNITINSKAQTLYAAQNGIQGVGYKFVSSSGYAYIKSASGTALAVGDSARTGTSQQQLQFLSVPVMAGYTVYSNRHFSIISSLGAAANFLTGTKVNTEINEPSLAKETVTLTRLNGLQHWYPSLLADAEMQYHLKPNMSLTLLPSFRYAISPLTQNNSVRTSPYSFGLGLGFTCHF